MLLQSSRSAEKRDWAWVDAAALTASVSNGVCARARAWGWLCRCVGVWCVDVCVWVCGCVVCVQLCTCVCMRVAVCDVCACVCVCVCARLI